MASAGRILIMPKGDWNAETEYEMLDLVFNDGASWVAKKTVVGIEPTEDNAEYWMKMCESVDLSEIENRLKILEDEEDVDLSGYFQKSGGTLTGDVTIQKADNGKSVLDKNHSESADYGTEITDYDANGNYIKVSVKANEELENAIGLSMNGGDFNRLFGEHNIDLIKTSLGLSSSEETDNLNVLDYDNAVEKSALYDLPYTCPSAGEVTVYVVPSSSAGLVGLKIDKNNYPVAYMTGYGGDYIATTFPVAEGDIINKNGSATNVTSATVTFRPYK